MNTIGKLSLTGFVGQNGRVDGRVSTENSIHGTITGKSSVSGYMAVGTVLEAELGTIIIVDENYNEVPAVLVEDEIAVTATPNDIRSGKTAITNEGIVVGTGEFSQCQTAEGYLEIPKGARFAIPHEYYDYDKLQAVICRFNTNIADSVAVTKVVLENNVYDVNSNTPISAVTKDTANACIDLGITNDTDYTCVIRYFIHKEIH